MASSVGFDPGSGSVTMSFTSNSRALTIRKHTFSGEIDNVGVVSIGTFSCCYTIDKQDLGAPDPNVKRGTIGKVRATSTAPRHQSSSRTLVQARMREPRAIDLPQGLVRRSNGTCGQRS